MHATCSSRASFASFYVQNTLLKNNTTFQGLFPPATAQMDQQQPAPLTAATLQQLQQAQNQASSLPQGFQQQQQPSPFVQNPNQAGQLPLGLIPQLVTSPMGAPSNYPLPTAGYPGMPSSLPFSPPETTMGLANNPPPAQDKSASSTTVSSGGGTPVTLAPGSTPFANVFLPTTVAPIATTTSPRDLSGGSRVSAGEDNFRGSPRSVQSGGSGASYGSQHAQHMMSQQQLAFGLPSGYYLVAAWPGLLT